MKRILIPVIFLGLICSYFISLTNSSGPPAAHTGAPGESNCTSCHAGTVNSGIALNNLLLSSSSGNFEYIPDSIYTITVSFSKVGCNRFGFQAAALKGADNTQAGTLIVTNAVLTQKVTSNVSGGIRQYIEHTFNGTTPSDVNAAEWSFNWQAPANNDGDIHFYVAANAANNNGSNTGDDIYTKSFAFTPSAQLPVASSTLNKNTLCAKDTVKAAGSATNNPTSWNWTVSPATGVNPSSSTLQNPDFIFNNSGSYTITLTAGNAKGPSAPVSKTVTVNVLPASPVITPNSGVSFCEGDSILLTSSTGNTYLWSNGKTSQSIYVKTGGNYTVQVSNANGCKSTSAPVTVTMNSKPLAVLNTVSPDTVCKTDTLIITADGAYASYRFYNGSTLLQQSNLPVLKIINPAFDSARIGLITVSSAGCTSDTSARIVRWFAEPLPAPVTSCDSVSTNSITFAWNAVSGAQGYEVSIDSGQSWANPSSGPAGTEHMVNGLAYNETVQLMVRAVGQSPCFKGLPDTLTCTTLSCSDISFVLVYDSTICKGDSASVHFSNLNLSSYSISIDNSAPVQDSIFTVQADSTREVHAVITDSLNLSCPPLDVYFTVTVHENPEADFFYYYTSNPNEVEFHDASTDATAWFWDFGDSSSSLVQNPVHTYDSDGEYTVTLIVFNDAGCTDSVTWKVQSVPDGVAYNTSGQVQVFPNPADKYLYCRITGMRVPVAEFEVYDTVGRLKFSKRYRSADGYTLNIQVPVSELTEGIYFVRIRHAGDTWMQKVQIRH